MDYTKHPEGEYDAVVVSHEIGVDENDMDVFRITARLPQGETVAMRIKLDPDKPAPVKRALKRLGHAGSLQPLYANGKIFEGRKVVLECRHWTNQRSSNVSEIWDFPRAEALTKIPPKRLAAIEAALGAATDDDVPF